MTGLRDLLVALAEQDGPGSMKYEDAWFKNGICAV